MERTTRNRHADLGLVLEAVQFATWKHRDQKRKDVKASPYINHPVALAELLWTEGGVRDAVVIASALPHDALDDTETSPAELKGAFGAQIAAIVQEVTDEQLYRTAAICDERGTQAGTQELLRPRIVDDPLPRGPLVFDRALEGRRLGGAARLVALHRQHRYRESGARDARAIGHSGTPKHPTSLTPSPGRSIFPPP